MDNNDNNKFTDVQNSQPEASVTPEKAFSESTNTPSVTGNTSDQAPSPKHKAPVGAIIIAIIVAGALAAVTIFAYRQTNKPTTSEQVAETSESVSSSDVDAVADEVDQTVSEMDSASDFVESELSDTTLGL